MAGESEEEGGGDVEEAADLDEFAEAEEVAGFASDQGEEGADAVVDAEDEGAEGLRLLKVADEVEDEEGVYALKHDGAAEDDGRESGKGAPLVGNGGRGLLLILFHGICAEGFQFRVDGSDESADDDFRDEENEGAREAEEVNAAEDEERAEGESHISAKGEDGEAHAAVLLRGDAVHEERALRVKHGDADAAQHGEEAEQVEIRCDAGHRDAACHEEAERHDPRPVVTVRKRAEHGLDEGADDVRGEHQRGGGGIVVVVSGNKEGENGREGALVDVRGKMSGGEKGLVTE